MKAQDLRFIFLLFALLIYLANPVFPYAKPYEQTLASKSYPTTEEVRYRIYWNGIRLGKMWLLWREEQNKYESHMQLETSGIAKLFSKQKRTASITGKIEQTENGTRLYIPEHFYSHVKRKRKERLIEITYENGMTKTVMVNPPDNPDVRPPVPIEKQHASYDPFTTLNVLLDYLVTLTNEKEMKPFKAELFDGRRLTGIDVKQVNHEDCTGQCLAVSGTRRLVAGFTEKERKKHSKEEEPPVFLHIRPNQSRFPDEAYAYTWLGKISAIKQ